MIPQAAIPCTSRRGGTSKELYFHTAGIPSDAALRDAALKAWAEAIRLKVGPMMNLGDGAHKAVPKMRPVAPARNGGTICTRSFIPHRMHDAIGVFGAVSVATACVTPGSVAVGDVQAVKDLEVKQPTGFYTVAMDVVPEDGQAQFRRAALLRTARRLMRGKACVPASIWAGR